MQLTDKFFEDTKNLDQQDVSLHTGLHLYAGSIPIYINKWLAEHKVDGESRGAGMQRFKASPEFTRIKEQFDIIIKSIHSWCKEHKVSGAEQWLGLNEKIQKNTLTESYDIYLSIYSDGKAALEQIALNLTGSKQPALKNQLRLMNNFIGDSRLTLCVAGLHVGLINLNLALSNNYWPKTLNAICYTTIQQLAIEFVNEKKLCSEAVGSEIHYANALCNSVCDTFNLPSISDVHAPNSLQIAVLNEFRKKCFDSLDASFMSNLRIHVLKDAGDCITYEQTKEFIASLDMLGTDEDFLTSNVFSEKLDKNDEFCLNGKIAENAISVTILTRMTKTGYFVATNDCLKLGLDLLNAAEANDMASVKILLGFSKISLTWHYSLGLYKDWSDWYAFHFAIQHNNPEMLQALVQYLQKHAQNEKNDPYRLNSALLIAAKYKLTNIVKILLSYDNLDLAYSENYQNKKRNVFYFACLHGNIEMLQELLQYPQVRNSKSDVFQLGELLLYAAFNNNTAAVKTLLGFPNIRFNWHYVDGEYKDWNAVHFAINHNNPEMLRALVQHLKTLAQGEKKDPYRLNAALLMAAKKNRANLVTILLSYDNLDLAYSEDYQNKKRNVFYFACMHGNIEMLQELLQYPQVRNSKSDTFELGDRLLYAAANNNTATVKTLLGFSHIRFGWHYVDGEHKDWNAFHFAINHNNPEMLRAFVQHLKTLEQGEKKDPYRLNAALLMAAKKNRATLVTILLSYDNLDLAYSEDYQNKKRNVFAFAYVHGNIEMLQELLQYPLVKNSSSDTFELGKLLLKAAEHNCTAAVRVLLGFSCIDMGWHYPDGEHKKCYAFQYAAKHKNTEMLQSLVQHLNGATKDIKNDVYKLNELLFECAISNQDESVRVLLQFSGIDIGFQLQSGQYQGFDLFDLANLHKNERMMQYLLDFSESKNLQSQVGQLKTSEQSTATATQASSPTAGVGSVDLRDFELDAAKLSEQIDSNDYIVIMEQLDANVSFYERVDACLLAPQIQEYLSTCTTADLSGIINCYEKYICECMKRIIILLDKIVGAERNLAPSTVDRAIEAIERLNRANQNILQYQAFPPNLVDLTILFPKIHNLYTTLVENNNQPKCRLL